MNNPLSEIISEALDIAGGGKVAFEINQATLLAMNVVADMELELRYSSHGRQSMRTPIVFSIAAREGAISELPSYIRYRGGFGGIWEIIEIVSDIEDLTAAENDRRRAILFSGDDPIEYRLSFDPDIQNEAEFWSAGESEDITGLNDNPQFPSEFKKLASTQVAIMLIDELMLMDNADNLIAFAKLRKDTLTRRLKNLRHFWTVYRTNAANTQSRSAARPYDPFSDYGDVFEIGG